MNKIIIILIISIISSCASISKNELNYGKAAGLEKKDLTFIKNITKDKIEEFIINKSLLINPEIRGIIVYESYEKTENVQEILNDYFNDKGYLVLLTGQYNNYKNKKNNLAIIKTDDQYDIIRIQNTGKGRKNMTPEKIIEKLKEWEKKFQFEITGAQAYRVKAKFINKPSDINKFAEELTLFCPELLNDGSGKINDLIKNMEITNSFYLMF